MPTYADSDGDLVTVSAGIEGIKHFKDGSISFKLIGGPYHDMVVRVYAPFDTIVFPGNHRPKCTYRINPPLSAKGKWCYVCTDSA